MDAPADERPDLSLDQLVELEERAAQRAREVDDGDHPDGDHGGGDHGGGDHEVIVLPWWQHPVNILTMVVTAAILAAMIGWMVGDSGAEPAHNDVDTGFLQDMREHHEQAVLMSFIYRALPDTDPGLRTIGRSIIHGQSIDIGRMIQLLRQFGETEINETDTSMTWMGMSAEIGQMPGMATMDELDELGRLTGDDADRLFVELMIAHHEGGLHMADFAAANADSEEVRLMAASMAGAQRGEIAEMLGVLDGS